MLLDGWVTATDLLRFGMHKKYGLPSLSHGKNYPGWVTKNDDSDLIIIKKHIIIFYIAHHISSIFAISEVK
jgi:hypothetical protein